MGRFLEGDGDQGRRAALSLVPRVDERGEGFRVAAGLPELEGPLEGGPALGDRHPGRRILGGERKDDQTQDEQRGRTETQGACKHRQRMPS